MARAYYAAYRPYGVSALNSAGPRGDVLVAFEQQATRDLWVALDSQHREPVAATAKETRAARRFEARNNYTVIVRWEDQRAMWDALGYDAVEQDRERLSA